MEKSSILQLIQLRLWVGSAGERTPTPWWRTQFFTEPGFRRLGQLFPRSGLRAGIESVTLVAGRDHDDAVGARAVHLFRLPSDLEQRVADVLSDPDALTQLDRPVDGLESILAALDGLAGEASGSGASGPRNLGSSSRTSKPSAIAELAATYAWAIRHDTRVHPYFDLEDVR